MTAAVILVVALLAVALLQRESRIYRRENPPTPSPVHRCEQRTCHRDAVITVTRRDTGEQVRVCPGCYDQGVAWGWWW